MTWLPFSEELPTALISRCLLGVPCRYHGRTITRYGTPTGRPALVRSLRERCHLLDICPECDAGLPTPRPPTRIIGGRWVAAGKDLTELFQQAALAVLQQAREHEICCAYLCKGSPACDPVFGATGHLLRQAGFKVISI